MAASIKADQTMRGISIMLLSYAVFSVSDAAVKWLVADYSVFQVLFVRSLMVCIAGTLFGSRQNWSALRNSRHKPGLVVAGTAVLGAFLCYFTAARSLGLAELVTIYFVAPVVVVVLSVLFLREKVGFARWVAVLLGFLGALVAARPGGVVNFTPAGFALASAFIWAVAQLLIRRVSVTESAFSQMIVSNVIFVVVTGAMLPWVWKTPTASAFGLMLFLGAAGGAAQYFLFEAYRFASASVLAPIEYTGLIYAFSLGYLIWADVPKANVVVGAVLIVCSSVGLVLSERARVARVATLPNPSEVVADV